METLLNGVLETLLYGGMGLGLMFISMFLFDLAVPYDFNRELKEKKCCSWIYNRGFIYSSSNNY